MGAYIGTELFRMFLIILNVTVQLHRWIISEYVMLHFQRTIIRLLERFRDAEICQLFIA
jgi:hypothetical protein